MDLEKNQYDFFFSTTSTILNSTMIHDALGKFSKWFWNPYFWLPVNFTWEDIQPREDFHYPDSNDILSYPLIICVFLLIIRYTITDPYIFYPLAKYYHLNLHRPPHPKENKELEKLYNKYNNKVPQKYIDRVADKLSWKTSDVQKWLKQKKLTSRQTLAEKFAESGFKLLAHIFFCILGVYALHNKIWAWDISHCWKKYPHHEVDGEIWFYYIFGLGLYMTLTVFQVLQSGGKDRFSMYVHHLFTILLISLSWTMNFVRVGTLVILVFQCSDWILLTAKVLQYLNKEVLTNIAFSITFLSWIFSRLIIYPTWILRSAFFEGPTYMFMPSAYLFYFMLLGLFLLSIMWFAMMIKVIYKKIKFGKLEDLRSSDEEEMEEEMEEKKVQ